MGSHPHRARRRRRTDHRARAALAFHQRRQANESTDPAETADNGQEPDRQPARQGEHNEEVLRELGYSDDEIIDFTKRGVLLHAGDTY